MEPFWTNSKNLLYFLLILCSIPFLAVLFIVAFLMALLEGPD